MYTNLHTMTLDTRPQVDTAPQTLTPEAQKVKDAMRDTTATGLENTRIANQTRALVEEVARTQEQRDAEAILASEFGILK